MTPFDAFALDPFLLEPVTVTVRVSTAALLGLVLGYDQWRPAAGFHAIGACAVALAAALMAIAAGSVFHAGAVPPIAAAESLAALFAWLAIGTVLYTRRNLRALTAAATLWIAAGTGLAIGSGLYTVGFVVAPLGIVLLATLRWLVAGERAQAALSAAAAVAEPVAVPVRTRSRLLPTLRTANSDSAERSVRTWWNR